MGRWGHGQASPGRPPRILLVDDHPAVSQRIGELLAGSLPDAEMVSAMSGEEGLSLAWISRSTWCCLTCACRPKRHRDSERDPNRQAASARHHREFRCRVSYATLARRAGAIDFVTKSALVQDLGRAVKSASGAAR